MCWNCGSQQYPKLSNFTIYSQIVNLITLIHFLLCVKFLQSQDSVNCCQLNKLDDVVRSKHWLSVSWAEAWVSRLLGFGWGHREKRRASIYSAPPALHRSSFALHHPLHMRWALARPRVCKDEDIGESVSNLASRVRVRSQREPPLHRSSFAPSLYHRSHKILMYFSEAQGK